MMTPALELRRVGLQIGGARILHDVSFSVASGEMVGVIGPNGAGKTTLFNIISGLARPTTGSVVLDGTDVTGKPVSQRARRGLGRTFQTSSVFPSLSVVENVRQAAQARMGAPASLLTLPRSTDAATGVAERCLVDVGLDHHAGAVAGVLSHGDKRKLEVAMVSAAKPSVVLLDEPMAGVGSGDVDGLVDVIRRLHSAGRTVLMVEHHIEVLLGLVDRVAVLHHGELLAIGTPQAVIADQTVQHAYLGEAV